MKTTCQCATQWACNGCKSCWGWRWPQGCSMCSLAKLILTATSWHQFGI